MFTNKDQRYINMNIITNHIQIDFDLECDRTMISNRNRRDAAAILSVDALCTITINHQLYFKAELAIFEFYKTLYMWKQQVKEDKLRPFHYYTIEYDEYEDGAILSLIPYSSKARLTTIWEEQPIYNMFELDDIVNYFFLMERRLKQQIETYFDIQLDRFVKHIPYCRSSNHNR